MVFVWDEDKNRINRWKHGISFEAAIRVFEDPCAVSYVDRVIDNDGVALVLVVHTIGENDGEETFRIISARKAGPIERSLYETSE